VLVCTPNGGRWVAVPEKALEARGSEWKLTGTLGDAFGLKGSLSVTESGNHHGLRRIVRDHHEDDAGLWLRNRLDLPIDAEIQVREKRSNPDGSVSLQVELNWPAFLVADAGGYRLPRSIVTPPPRSWSGDPVPARVPVRLPQEDAESWNLELALPQSLQARKPQSTWSDDRAQFSWLCKPEPSMSIQFKRQARAAAFTGADRAKGLEQMRAYRQAYERFWLYESLLLLPGGGSP